jgi:hypothetical protein
LSRISLHKRQITFHTRFLKKSSSPFRTRKK